MTPLDLAVPSFRTTDFEFDPAVDGQRLSGWSLKMHAVGFAAHRFLAPQLQDSEQHSVQGHISEPHPITSTDEELRNLGIVSEARLVAFSYPVVGAQELKPSARDAGDADVAFLIYGGYMYFDADMVLIDVRAITPSDEGCLRFGLPQQWLPQWTVAAGVDSWRPVTLPELRALGVRYFAWLRPGESLGGGARCRNGGFAYIFHEPSQLGTLQAKFDVFFQIEDAEVDQGKCCPQCGCIMEWSDYSQGAYASGWVCENVGSCGQSWTSEPPLRWFCPECEIDICSSCGVGLSA